jgi:hypothetical protein
MTNDVTGSSRFNSWWHSLKLTNYAKSGITPHAGLPRDLTPDVPDNVQLPDCNEKGSPTPRCLWKEVSTAIRRRKPTEGQANSHYNSISAVHASALTHQKPPPTPIRCLN